MPFSYMALNFLCLFGFFFCFFFIFFFYAVVFLLLLFDTGTFAILLTFMSTFRSCFWFKGRFII